MTAHSHVFWHKLALRLCACLLLVAALSGCAMQWQKRAADPAVADSKPQWALAMQQTSTVPLGGLIAVAPADLQPGDILFSAANGWNSLTLRLFSYSAVSHAFIYLGNDEAAEAVGHGGVRIISMEQALGENNLLVAYRHPGLTADDAAALRSYAHKLAGRSYNYWGIVRQAPFTLTRKTCELPALSAALREFCVSALALLQVGPGQNERFFCSEFVVNSFNHVGKPLTSAPPAWVNPADLLHLRDGDVPAMPAKVRLKYVGHLRCTPSPWNPSCQADARVAEQAGSG